MNADPWMVFSRLLVNATWQAGLVTLLVIGCCWLLRKSSPTLRHALLLLALAKFALPPMLAAPTGVFSQLDLRTLDRMVSSRSWNDSSNDEISTDPREHSDSTAEPYAVDASEPMPVRRGTVRDRESPVVTIGRFETAFAGTTSQRDMSPTNGESTKNDPLRTSWVAVLTIHAIGVLFLLGRIVIGSQRRRHMWSAAQRVPPALAAELASAMRALGVERRIEMRVSDRESGPCAFGVLKRRILLPTSFAALTSAQRRAVLGHEVAHHARGDLAIGLFAEIVRCLHWPNPAIWLLVAQLRKTREECCDDLVLARNLTAPEVYGEALVRSASLQGSAVALHGARMSDHPIGRRLRRLFALDIERRSSLSKRDAVIVLALALVVLPGVRASIADRGPQPAPAPTSAAAKREIGGRVTTPSGQPISGARIYLSSSDELEYPRRPDALRALTDENGGYRFAALEADLWRNSSVRIIAQHAEHGFALARVRSEANDFVLADSDAPLWGTILDTEGSPISGASVRFRLVHRDPSGDPARFLADLEAERLPAAAPAAHLDPADWPAIDAVAISDARGHVSIRGVTPGALVVLEIDAPGRARALAHVLATEMEPILHPRQPIPGSGSILFQGSRFEVVLGASRVVSGVVRDRTTLRPLANVEVGFASFAPDAQYEMTMWRVLEHVRTVTDAHGRYRLDGLPAHPALRLEAEPRDPSQGHLLHTELLPAGQGESEIALDFELDRVVPIGLRVIDAETRLPLPNVRAHSSHGPNHPLVNEHPDYFDVFRRLPLTNDDGIVFVPYLPGPGELCVGPVAGYRYRPEGEDPYDTLVVDGERMDRRIVVPEIGADPPALRTIELHRIRDRIVRFVDGNGEPLVGCRLFNEIENAGWSEPHRQDRATLVGYDPAQPRPVFAAHSERALSGYLIPDPAASEQIIKLVPSATVRARLVDSEGRPRSAVDLSIFSAIESEVVPGGSCSTHELHRPMRVVTDSVGEFALEGLKPGVRYMLSERVQNLSRMVERHTVFEWFGVDPGAVYDMGDVMAEGEP